MKKFLLMLFLPLFFVKILFSFSYGLKTNISLDKYNIKPNIEKIDYSFLPTIKIGFSLEFFLKKNLCLAPGLLIGTSGSNFQINYLKDQLINGKYTSTIVSLPINLNYYIWHSFYFSIGPQFDFFLNHKLVFENNDSIDIKENSNGIGLANYFGINYIFNSLKTPIHIQLGYLYSFTNRFKNVEYKANIQSLTFSIVINIKRNHNEKKY